MATAQQLVGDCGKKWEEEILPAETAVGIQSVVKAAEAVVSVPPVLTPSHTHTHKPTLPNEKADRPGVVGTVQVSTIRRQPNQTFSRCCKIECR
ncbi:unnamed protein product [Protopolystoma xenopodis]|uniref:Uncharacterized protein n=1 Tax=Protopolystoma xenopodis TaxID=117903 RepID=A0A3S4ZSL2_9PLAT|nr:unnamed protein product [Protopolystoma xenopodis]